jgi:hypothetical protein
MLRKILFILVLAAAPAMAQQPAQTPAKPAQAHAMSADTTKAKAHRRARHAAKARAKGTAARRDSTAQRDSIKP